MSFMQKLRQVFGAQDLTVGSPLKGLLLFSVPLLIGNLTQQMYNTVDAYIVGSYTTDGVSALAAVGNAGPIMNLLLVLFMGISTGASILSAQYFGAKERDSLNKVIGCSIFLIFVSGLIMMVAGFFLTPLLIGLTNPASELIGRYATEYLQIYFLGIVGCGLYNIIAGVLRGLGDSVYPLIFLIVACVMNIFLDIYFVRNLKLEVAGAAWATIISQGVSGILCLIRLCMLRSVCDVKLKYTVKPDLPLMGKLAKLGLPSGITQAIFSTSAIIVQNLTNSLGPAMVAANTVVMRVDGFAMMPNFTFGTAATTYVGQNIGARKADRLKQGIPAMLRLGLTCSVIMVTAILLFGQNLMTMFISPAESYASALAKALADGMAETDAIAAAETARFTAAQAIEIGVKGLRTLAVGYICFSVTNVLQGSMRGAGETVIPMYCSIFTTVILRMPLAYLLAYLTRSETWINGTPDAIYFSLLTSWVVGMLIAIITYRMGWWKRKLPDDLRQAMSISHHSKKEA